MSTPLLLLPAVCWALLVSLAATDVAAARVQVFHMFSASNKSLISALSAQEDAIVASLSDLVVLTAAPSGGNDRPVDGALAVLLEKYTSAGGNRVWARSDAWQVVRDSAVDGAVWTRLKQTRESVFACVAVSTVPTDSADTVAAQIADRVESFCAAQDVLLLGFTAPLSPAHASFIRGDSAINGKQVDRATVDLADLARQKPGLGDVTSAERRLFLHVPATTCLEDARVAPLKAAVASLVTTFRFGADCEQTPRSPSGQSSNETSAEQTPKRGDKRALIVLLSCGTFLLGCGVIFYVFFRKQFFMPSESSKPEKELTTNLAYVLRM
ncbi:hypothetical protein ATCC90586_008042 [Pythium insidiosum]|nr:hypothetical protein ATCC90586_008042 [Pythium insidiosum]